MVWLIPLLLLVVALTWAFLRLHRAEEEAAAVEARNLLAREIHTGLEQELTFIATQSRRLQRTTDEPLLVDQLSEAAARALSGSRSAVGVLEDAGLDPELARPGERFPRRDRTRTRVR